MELAQYQDYEEYKKAMNTVLNRTVEDFVMTGYLLKQGRDTDILKDSGYSNVNEFAWAEYKLEATQVSRICLSALDPVKISFTAASAMMQCTSFFHDIH